jgi:hypothetical protein
MYVFVRVEKVETEDDKLYKLPEELKVCDNKYLRTLHYDYSLTSLTYYSLTHSR